MTPAADTHVHLLAGHDDGPQTRGEAVAMARRLVADGARHATALAHQNPHWPLNTPARLSASAAELQAELDSAGVPLRVHPTGEVVFGPDLLDRFRAGDYQTYGGHGRHLLVEMPHGTFFDPCPLAPTFAALGVRLVIAHAERYPELLYDFALAERCVRAGLLIQVTTEAVADPQDAAEERAVKEWFVRGVVHAIGSDGHNLDRRPIRLGAGLERIRKWVGPAATDRVAGLWGTALLTGGVVNPPPPLPKPRGFFGRLLGG